MICFLYRVTHRATGNSYLGVSINPKKRWGEHRRDAKVRPQGRFHRALGKHGPDAFDWQIVREFSSTAEAKLAELCFIYLEEPALNLTAGGDGNWGYVQTADAIERGASKRRGRPSPSTLLLNATKKGVRQTPEHVEKRVSCFRGKKRDPVAVEKTRAANTGRKHSPEQIEANRLAQLAFQASRTPSERAAATTNARRALQAKRASR